MAKTIGYFPTIDGNPGRWEDDQIWHTSRAFPVRLEKDRATVRRQIAKTIAFRERMGWTAIEGPTCYDIVRVAA